MNNLSAADRPSAGPADRSPGCACDVCYCGSNCQCTETLCRCEASSLLNSLSRRSSSNVGNATRGSASSPSRSCCEHKSHAASNSNTNNKGTSRKQVSFRDNEGTTPKDNAEETNEGSSKLETLEVGIEGMTCSMCSKAITQSLKRVEAVSNVTVSLATDSATITYDPSKATPQDLYSAIEDVGYEAVPPASSSNESSEAAGKTMVEFAVRGMTCSMCTQAIQRSLEAVSGVEDVSVSLSTNMAKVTYLTNSTTKESLREAIENVGYEVAEEHVLNTEEGEISEDRLERLLHQQERQVTARKQAFLWSLAGTCPILIMTMILPHLPHEAGLEKVLHKEVRIGHFKVLLEALILWILCTPIQFGSGWSFFKTSYLNLKQGVMGMDVLVAVGTSASYGYAVWATLTGSMEYHFFETSAVLICFVLLGKWLQRLAMRRTSQALTHLLALQPKMAIRVIPPAGADNSNGDWSPLTDSYQENVVPSNSIKEGDLVKVKKGSSIPADGRVKFGEMSVNESMITGESVAVLKTKGSVVLGGTICAEAGQEAGASFVEVTGVGSSTALSQIVKLVQDAQNRQVPIQNLADKIAGIFVPTVVSISVLTYMVWYALIQSGIVPSSYLPEGESPATFSLLFGISCLVISCPCALGLATPTAVMVGTGVGAQQGILMKGGETLELASQVDSVVFDKTGTLTKGKPAVTDFSILVTDAFFGKEILKETNHSEGRTTKEHLLWLLGSLERNSEHPLAGAIVSYAEKHLKGAINFAQPTNFMALTGRGASGTIEGSIDVAVGNRAFCDLNSINIDQPAEDAMQRMERQGKTAIVAAINRQVCVVMGVADQLKADAADAISYLRDEMGVDVWMVTGDNRRTARAIARQLRLPMDRLIAEALPAAKVQKVQELQENGHVVAMVGDGVNDSPALAQANVGLSLGTGAEIAAEASDMVLVKGNVADVCTALDLSQVIFRRIKVRFRRSARDIKTHSYDVLSSPFVSILAAQSFVVALVQLFEYPDRSWSILPDLPDPAPSHCGSHCHGLVVRERCGQFPSAAIVSTAGSNRVNSSLETVDFETSAEHSALKSIQLGRKQRRRFDRTPPARRGRGFGECQ